MRLSLSMPQLFPDHKMPPIDAAFCKQLASKLLASPLCAPLRLDTVGSNLYTVVGDSNFPYDYVFALDARTKELIYFIEHKTYAIGLGKAKAVTQVMLWRNRRALASNNLGATVFFQYLLPTYTTIMTDTKQTADGRRFWEIRLAEAIRSKLYCYAYERMVDRLAPITVASYGHDIDRLWGDTEEFQHNLALISRVPLGDLQ